MTGTVPPRVECDRVHPALNVPDVASAVEFYRDRLGFSPGFTWGEPPTMAGMNLGEVQIFLQQGEPDPRAAAVFFVVGDADELHAYHRAAGVQVVEEIGDREYGMRDYLVRDLHGHRLAFGHYIYNVGEPVVVEREEVTVRLEKRLAALVRDLAAHKRMTVGECLEEIVLHSCEPLGDGVASPHTGAQLRHIQQLKRVHGIDYDTHAGYRFVER